jgi:hypothetical protein
MDRQRRLLAVLPLIVIALLISACGSSTPTGTAGTGGDGSSAKAGKAVRFARCMRDHGISEFPDPPASGSFTIDEIANGSSLNTNTPAFTQALSACRGLEPAGFTGTKRSSQQQKAALEFAACMRRNGVPDFPDPAPDSPLIDTNDIPSVNRPGGMSALNAAQQRCSSVAAVAIGKQP